MKPRREAARSAPRRSAPCPSEAPRFCAVPWSPPASFVLLWSTDDMITLPSCESSRPAPMPKTASAIAKPVPFELDVDRAEQARTPRRRARASPTWRRASARAAPRAAARAARRAASPPTSGTAACPSRTRRSRARPGGRRAARRTCPSGSAAASAASRARRAGARSAAACGRAARPRPRRSRRSSHRANAPRIPSPAEDQERHDARSRTA